MPDQHWPISPSGLARLDQCPGSLRLCARFPEDLDDEDAAAEGVAAHWVLEQRYHRRDVAAVAPNGVVVTREMHAGADLALQQLHGLEYVQCEVPLLCKRIHPECAGTPDLRGWKTDVRIRRSTAVVIDYKFGYRPVEAWQNAQLTAYLSGMLEGVNDTQVDFLAVIVQPRAPHPQGPVRMWGGPATDLRPLVNRLSNRAHEAMGPEPTTRTGEQCRHCRGRHACDALQRAGALAMEAAGGSTPLELSDAALGIEAAMLATAAERLDARLSGLRAEIEARLRRGANVRGWAMGRGRGSNRWRLPDEQVIALLGPLAAKPAAALTPKQAQDAGANPAIVQALSEHVPGAATPVRDDGSTAARIFGS